MEHRCVVWVLSAFAMVWGLGGCALDPYIRSTPGPTYSRLEALCKAWKDKAVEAGEARAYAECMRRSMEAKAGRYATMNNGGGALLIGVAGLAAYRGYRGGHEANVAALTTGGAALYGGQQYLYRKPREVIYWSGSGAIGCAIGIADRQIQAGTDAGTLRREGLASTASEWNALQAAHEAEQEERDRIQPNASCPANLRNEWKKLRDAAAAVDMDAQLKTLQGQLRNAELRLLRHEAGSRFSRINLIAATNAIRDAVNRQLAMEQPNPAELGQLLTGLKLPALEAAAAKPAATDGDVPAESKDAVVKQDRFLSLSWRFDSKVQGLETLPEACNIDDRHVKVYANRVEQVSSSYRQARDSIASLEMSLDLLDASAGKSAGSEEMLKLCPLARDMALTPFALVLPQQGVQVLKQGDSLVLPITGGVPPFSASPAAALGKGSLAAAAEATDTGGYRFRVTASKDAEKGTYALIASDAAGVTRVFQVQVQ